MTVFDPDLNPGFWFFLLGLLTFLILWICVSLPQIPFMKKMMICRVFAEAFGLLVIIHMLLGFWYLVFQNDEVTGYYWFQWTEPIIIPYLSFLIAYNLHERALNQILDKHIAEQQAVDQKNKFR